MIENKNEASKNLEKALQALQQAKQRVANEKKKQNKKKRKAENHHKYIMGGIIVKYFPDCYHYDEGELNRILSVAMQTKECQQIIFKIKAESQETVVLQIKRAFDFQIILAVNNPGGFEPPVRSK